MGEKDQGSVPDGREPADHGDAANGHALAARLGELARALEREHDVGETLDTIVHAAAGTVPGAQHASISAVLRRREVHTRAATDELPRAVDNAQYETGQGPCLDTLFERRTERVSDVAADQRWPEFTKRAVELGVGSMLAVQLYVHGDDLGALNLISEHPHAFDEESESVALLFAAHAAVAMAAAQQIEQLEHAVSTRDTIGQAKGILIERFGITGDQAFMLLARASQHENRKLHEIAAELVATGQLPSPRSASTRSSIETPNEALPRPTRL
jgi:GAF domain-containing protein